jgi:hypothetical protein
MAIAAEHSKPGFAQLQKRAEPFPNLHLDVKKCWFQHQFAAYVVKLFTD